MFGDAGHAFILLLTALAMIYFEKKILNSKNVNDVFIIIPLFLFITFFCYFFENKDFLDAFRRKIPHFIDGTFLTLYWVPL